MSVGKRDYLSRSQILWIFLILNSMAKTKLAQLVFLCCGEIVKNSIVPGELLFTRHQRKSALDSTNVLAITCPCHEVKKPHYMQFDH